jgi:hypothetical protein
MDQAQIIPTQYKTKIPHTHSYPIGAERLSVAFAGVPQFAELTVRFRLQRPLRERVARPGLVLNLESTKIRPGFSASKGAHESRFYRPNWGITVYAVPRCQRYLIQGKLIEVLPSVRLWLLDNPSSAQKEGVHGISFRFDELKEELIREDHTSVEWNTERG